MRERKFRPGQFCQSLFELIGAGGLERTCGTSALWSSAFPYFLRPSVFIMASLFFFFVLFIIIFFMMKKSRGEKGKKLTPFGDEHI